MAVSPVFCFSQDVSNLKLKDYTPVSLYKIPQTNIQQAKYPVIDFHSHDWVTSRVELDQWVRTMDEKGIEKSIILSYATGARFDSIAERYAAYPTRFEVWCGFDYTAFDTPEGQRHAVQELERCYRKGARGVGELGDKGLGEFYSLPVPGYGVHIDDPRMQPLLQKCAVLNMPVSIHVAEDAWMYEEANAMNDGLMNAATWKVDMTKPGILTHDQLVGTLENAVSKNPKTTFIACHLANCCANLAMLGKLFDRYPNLYAEMAARFGEIAPVPRYTKAFFEKYQDRILYGTDMYPHDKMYTTTFRILESADEHFYETARFGYHWALYGLALSDKTLKKIYRDNGKKILKR